MPIFAYEKKIKKWKGSPGGSDGKESACNARDLGLIPGSWRSPGGGNSNPLQHSCLESPMDRGTWQATVHGITESQILLSDWAHADVISSHFLLQEIFMTQGSNPGLLHCRRIVNHLSHLGSPIYVFINIHIQRIELNSPWNFFS